MSAERGRRPDQPSYLITEEENEQLFNLIGSKCQSLATALAQVLSADPPSRSKWTKNHIGVLCFIKDYMKRSYFFRVFCLERQVVVWEQELYINFEYRAPRPYFHTFEGDTCRIGLNFADIGEASTFLTAVIDHLRSRVEKQANRRHSQHNSSLTQHSTPGSAPLPRLAEKQSTYQANQYQLAKKRNEEPERATGVSYSKRPIVNKFNTLRKKTKDKRKTKVKKADIGVPMNFEHVSHAGLNPNQGFSFVNVDSELLTFFASAGVSEKHLNNRKTRQFIYDFLDQHGGREAAIREVTETHQKVSPKKHPAPPTPQLPVKMPPPSVKPPSPPTSTLQRETQKEPVSSIPPPPPMAVPPPAPPMNSLPSPPPMSSSVPPPPPMKNNAPPPPPLPVSESHPPPPSEASALPVPPPLLSQSNSRSDLMSAIREGQTLKPVSETERTRLESYSSDPKSDLLDQIRAGKELKHVERSENPVPNKQLTPDGIAGALARALQDRSRVIHSESESDQDEHEDDDWDDWVE